jgi:hypothetical protein
MATKAGQPKFNYNIPAILDRLTLVAMQMDMELVVNSGNEPQHVVLSAFLVSKTNPDYKIQCFTQAYNYERTGKVEFSTYFSRDIVCWYDSDINSCSSLMTKDISKIVKDIEEKVLFNYEENLKAHQEREQKELEVRKSVRAFKDELVEKKLVTYYSNNSPYEFLQVPLKYAKIVVRETGNVKIELDSLTQDEARVILDAIQNMRK